MSAPAMKKTTQAIRLLGLDVAMYKPALENRARVQQGPRIVAFRSVVGVGARVVHCGQQIDHVSREEPHATLCTFFSRTGTAIHIDRSQNNHIYGNLVVHDGGCIDAAMINEDVSGQPHVDEIHHNTCAFSSIGITTDPAFSTTVTDNVMLSLQPGGTEAGNINAAGADHTIDCNAYDDDSYYHQGLYDQGVEHRSLAEWQTATGYDTNSVEAPGGACELVDPPTSPTDMDFDLHVASGACLTLGCSGGGEVGVFGYTDCVGYTCMNPSGSGGSAGTGGSGGSGGTGATGGGAGAGGSSGVGGTSQTGGAGGIAGSGAAAGTGAAAGATATAPPEDDGGCSCRMGRGTDRSDSAGKLTLLGAVRALLK